MSPEVSGCAGSGRVTDRITARCLFEAGSRASRPDKDLKLVAQLYEGRDVILEKLDRPNNAELTCGAKLKVITTKFLDVQNNKTDV